MGNKKNHTDYSKMYTKTKAEETTQVEATDVTTEEPVKPVKKVIGVVSNCERLNMRIEPNMNASVTTILTKDTEVEINKKLSTKEFYHVNSNSITGYCKKEFITIK